MPIAPKLDRRPDRPTLTHREGAFASERRRIARPASDRGRPAPAAADRLLQIWNMCVGLFGVQIVWGLQNVNTSRIFQTLGAQIDQLPILWIAGADRRGCWFSR